MGLGVNEPAESLDFAGPTNRRVHYAASREIGNTSSIGWGRSIDFEPERQRDRRVRPLALGC